MKRRIAIIVLVSFVHWLCLPFVAAYNVYAQEKEMTGRIVGCDKDTSCYINLGSKNNVKEGMEFDVTRKGKPIGKAKIVKVNKYSSLVTVTVSGVEKPEAFDAVSVKLTPTQETAVEEKTEAKLPDVKKETEIKPEITNEVVETKAEVKEEIKSEDVTLKMEETTKESVSTSDGEFTLAVVNAKNSSKYEGKDIEEKVTDALIGVFKEKTILFNRTLNVIERTKLMKLIEEKAYGVVSSGKLSDGDSVDPLKMLEVAKTQAEVVVVPTINSVTMLKKSKEAYVSISARAIEVESGKILFSESATGGSGKKQGGDDALVDLAVKRACSIFISKIPGEVINLTTKFSKDSIEINLGEDDGVKKNDKLEVRRDGKKIGMVTILSVDRKSSVALFVSDKAGLAIAEKDVVHPRIKDDELPKAKGKKNSTLMLIGGAVVLGVVLALSGKKKDEGTTPKTVPAPPLPPN